jgi:peptidoglycan hydrolase-like protein with peptidoglycan-binding domain
MSKWKIVFTLTAATALVATTAFAQSNKGGSDATGTKPDVSSPSASPSTSTDKSTSDTGKSDTMKSDTMKSDTMKSDTMSGDHAAMGSSGGAEQVKAVQQALKDKGHDPGAIDGVMGPKTRSALKDFQKKEGLSDSGRLDHETLARLGVEGASASPATSGGSSMPSSSPGSSAPSSSSTTEKK